MAERTIFTHIPKVAGTSIMHQLVRANFATEEIKHFRGVPDLLRSRGEDYRALVGHTPYGVGAFAGGDCRYFVMLRDPVRRALSHYYFIRKPPSKDAAGPSNPDQKRTHQTTALADIFEVNRKRRYRLFTTWLVDNMQTRYVAGWPHYWRAPDSTTLLAAAKRNLEANYAAIGLQERFEESIDRIADAFGWQVGPAEGRHKASPAFDPPDAETMRVLEDNHKLDAELYDFALTLFDKG